MEYILSMVFTTSGGKKTTMSINTVKPDLTKEQIFALMDLIIEKDVFSTDSGNLVGKDSAQLTERKVTKFEVA